MGQQSFTAKDTKEKNSLTAKGAKDAKNSIIRTKKGAKELRQSRYWIHRLCGSARNGHGQYRAGFGHPLFRGVSRMPPLARFLRALQV